MSGRGGGAVRKGWEEAVGKNEETWRKKGIIGARKGRRAVA